MGKRKEKEKKKKGGLPRERLTTENARKDKYERRNMNGNDLSDLVSKTKKSGGSKTKRTRAKRAQKQPLPKKLLVLLKKEGEPLNWASQGNSKNLGRI